MDQIKLGVTSAVVTFSPDGANNLAYSATASGITNNISDFTTTAFTGAQYTAAATADGNNVVTSAASTGTTYVDDVFSAYTYTGNGVARSIVNGIDLAGKGGLVWHKNRDSAVNNILVDSVTGLTKYRVSNTTAADDTFNYLSSFNSDGFSILSSDSGVNFNTGRFVTWTFRKAPKFFDIVQFNHTS